MNCGARVRPPVNGGRTTIFDERRPRDTSSRRLCRHADHLVLAAALTYAIPSSSSMPPGWPSTPAMPMFASSMCGGQAMKTVTCLIRCGSIRNRFVTPPRHQVSCSRGSLEKVMGTLGINNRYGDSGDDRGGLLAASLVDVERGGHANVALVNGGWVAWTAEHRPVVKTTTPVTSATFKATLQPAWLATLDDVKAGIGKAGTRILDARTVAEMGRFRLTTEQSRRVIPSAEAV